MLKSNSLLRLLVILWAVGPVALAGAEDGERLQDVALPGRHGQPDQSYALFVPAGPAPEAGRPAIYCFDPRGRGRLCLDLYLPAARRHGFVIASSNDSRSDGPMEPNLRAMKALWKDTHERLALDDRRAYTTGFSGGARVANLMARVLGLAGVIAHGGGFPPSVPPAADVSFDFYGLIGELDFNYYELRELGNTLTRLELPHHIEVFEGAHQWAGPAECGEAIDWMQRRAMQRGLLPPDRPFVEAGWRNALQRAEAARAAGRRIEALDRYRAAARDYAPWVAVDAARDAIAALEASPAVRKGLRDRRRRDDRSARYLSRLAEVLEELRTTAGPPPTREALLARLEIRKLLRGAGGVGSATGPGEVAGDVPHTEEARSARRLLQMVLVQTSFTQVQALRAAGEHARAARALEVAVVIAPESPLHWYNLACYRALSGNTRTALDALERAFEAGFDDPAAAADDPDLLELRELDRFRELIGRHRGN